MLSVISLTQKQTNFLAEIVNFSSDIPSLYSQNVTLITLMFVTGYMSKNNNNNNKNMPGTLILNILQYVLVHFLQDVGARCIRKTVRC